MSDLLRRFWAWRTRRQRDRDSEHGAIAAILAVLLGGGVLLGMGAIVVDVGLLHLEKEELQSAADAASYRVALQCARGKTPCTNADQTPTAEAYARNNVKDKKTFAQVCISGTTCPAWNTPAITCPPLPTPPAGTAVGNYVEVRTSTQTTSGGSLMPPIFGNMFPGSTYTGLQVGACARVNWGPPADVGKVLALGISLCDWKRMTTDGNVYYGPLGNLLSQTGLFSIVGLPTPNTAATYTAIVKNLPLTLLGIPATTCGLGDLSPRGYVWLNNPDGTMPDSDCMIDVNVGDNPQSFLLSGLIPGLYCAQKLKVLAPKREAILVPIYDTLVTNPILSLQPSYHIVGFAPFVLTGYSDLLGSLGTLLTGGLLPGVASLLCTVLSDCIYGYFTQTIVPKPRPVFGTGKNFGATVIGRTG